MTTSKFDILEKLVAQSAARVKKLERDNELLELQVSGLNTELKKFQNSQSEVRRLNNAREATKKKLTKLASKVEHLIGVQEKALRAAYGITEDNAAPAAQTAPEPEIDAPNAALPVAAALIDSVAEQTPQEPSAAAPVPAAEEPAPETEQTAAEPAEISAEPAELSSAPEVEPETGKPAIHFAAAGEPVASQSAPQADEPVREPGTEPDEEADTSHLPDEEAVPDEAVSFNVAELETQPAQSLSEDPSPADPGAEILPDAETPATPAEPAASEAKEPLEAGHAKKTRQPKASKPAAEPVEDDLPLFRDLGL